MNNTCKWFSKEKRIPKKKRQRGPDLFFPHCLEGIDRLGQQAVVPWERSKTDLDRWLSPWLLPAIVERTSNATKTRVLQTISEISEEHVSPSEWGFSTSALTREDKKKKYEKTSVTFFFLNGVELSLNPVNSANSGNLINLWSMNLAQFKDSVSHMCLSGTVVASWFLTQEVAGSSLFIVMTNIFVTKFNEFSKTFKKNSNEHGISINSSL